MLKFLEWKYAIRQGEIIYIILKLFRVGNPFTAYIFAASRLWQSLSLYRMIIVCCFFRLLLFFGNFNFQLILKAVLLQALQFVGQIISYNFSL